MHQASLITHRVAEYFHQLRSCIQHQIRPNHESTASNHLETSSYWKAEYDKSDLDRIALQARISEMERELEIFKADKLSVPLISQGKRKRDARRPTQTSTKKKSRSMANGLAPAAESTLSDEVLQDNQKSTSSVAGKNPLACSVGPC